jgi:MFS family permease
MFAVPLIVYKNTGSVALSGLAMFIEWLPRVVSLPIAGSLSDRVGGWRVYGMADTIRSIACLAAVAVALLAPATLFGTVTALMAVCAFFYAQAFIALEATVPLLVPHAAMPKAQGMLQGIDQASMVGGPAVGALCVIWIDPFFLIPVAALLFLTSAALVYSLRQALRTAFEQVTRGPARSVFADIKAGANVLRRQPFLWKLVVLSMLVNGTVGLSLATGAALTLGKFGQGDSHFGVLQTMVGIFSIASLMLLPRLTRSFSVFALGICAYIGIAAGGLIMGLAENFAQFVFGFALSYGLCGLFNVYIRTERLRWIPAEHFGKTISVIVLLNQLSLPLSGLLVSVTATHVAPQRLFLFTAAVAAAVCILILPSLRRYSRANAALAA